MKGITSIEKGLLEESLQEMTEENMNGVKGIFIFSPNFPAFKGHFPDQPVLPAVVQMAAVRLLAARYLNTKLIPVRLERAKFKNMVGPEEPVTVTISLDRSDNDVTISFTITTDQSKVSTGEMICRF